MRRASSSANAARLQRPQIGDRDREHEGELLRLRAARRMDDAAVGGRERPAEALVRSSSPIIAGEHRGDVAPRERAAAGRRHARRADRSRNGCRSRRAQCRGCFTRPARMLPASLACGDRSSSIAIRHRAGRRRARARVQPRCPRGRSRRRRARPRNERQPGRAVVEIVQRFRIGGAGSGMIDALHQLPGGAGARAGNRARVRACARRAARCADRHRSCPRASRTARP